MQIGTTKDQGLYGKPSAKMHPGALAAGTLPQYNTTQYNSIWTCPSAAGSLKLPALRHCDMLVIFISSYKRQVCKLS